jgi:mRNA-degrading endonuclease RelE of RelBE toxin-antitoxin system
VITDKAVAAVIDLVTGPLLRIPHRLLHPPTRELKGIWLARRGTFRILYCIDETKREVTVSRVDDGGDAHRRR